MESGGNILGELWEGSEEGKWGIYMIKTCYINVRNSQRLNKILQNKQYKGMKSRITGLLFES